MKCPLFVILEIIEKILNVKILSSLHPTLNFKSELKELNEHTLFCIPIFSYQSRISRILFSVI